MYDYVGAPAKTDKLVREIMQRLYVGSEIGQGYPGDEDNGEMSSWFILSSLGLYPLQAGSPNWAVGSPLFRKVTVHRSTGDIVVNAPNNSTSNVYVEGLKVNGHKQSSVSINSAVLSHGGTLDFDMGSRPSSWGTGRDDAPPSLTKGSTAPKPLQDTTGPSLGVATGPDGMDATKLFDDTSTTGVTFPTATPQITWKYNGNRQRPTFYTMTSGSAAGDPSAWRLQGSNDGVRWTTVDSRSNETFDWRLQTQPFTVEDPGWFKYFRLAVTKTVGAPQTSLAEVELLSGGDVTIGGGPLNVAAAPTLDGVAGGPVSGSLATVTGGTGTTASDYSATVDWGDGTAPAAATMGNSSRGVFAVTGSHTYSKAGYYQVGVTVSDGHSQGVATATVNVVFAPSSGITTSFDSTCIGDDGVAGVNCDGSGWSYSRAALNAAGLVQGRSATVPGTGLHYTLPVVPALHPDNLTGAGQTVALNIPDDATHISFIGVGTNGPQQGTATVTFTDGTTATTPIQYSDWTFGGDSNGTPSFGNIIVARSGYRLKDGGHDPNVTFLFATAPYAVPAGKHVASVTMPSGNSDIHVFAVADDGTAPPALALTAPSDQTATAGTALAADLGKVAGGVGPYQARVQWGDGTATEDAAVSDAGAVTGTHTYTQPGAYTVHVTAADTQGSVLSSFKVTVAAAGGQLAAMAAPAAPPAVPVRYTPHLVTSATAGPRGTTVTVNGDSFAPNELVTLHLGSASVQARADAHGILTNATLTVPSSAKVGSVGLTATGTKSATPASAAFDVTARPVSVAVYRPQLQLEQSGPGVTLRGHGFAPNERVAVSVDGRGATTATADASGAISGVELPAAADGGHSVQAAGVRSLDPATASYLVAGGHARTARTGAVHGGPPAHGTPGAPSGPASPSPSAHAVGRSGGDGVPLWWLLAPAVALLAAAAWWRRRRTT
ncbi:MAG TPA: glycoside hydrolase domain-containing protein, partial [Jatrophihabitantaceae bacterium]